MEKLAIFLDDGGVMNDNRLRAAQWQRWTGEFLAPRLGGRPEAWAEANLTFATALFHGGTWQERLRAATDYASFERSYYLGWLQTMCEMIGITPPPDEEAFQLAREAGVWITSHVRADFPGATEAIRLLHERGHALYTSSATVSAELAGYLSAMGARDYFTRLYGPDLVDTIKASPAFYERILEDAGVAPFRALVLDDNPEAVAWASQAGARTVLVGTGPAPQLPGCMGVIGSLAELPVFLHALP